MRLGRRLLGRKRHPLPIVPKQYTTGWRPNFAEIDPMFPDLRRSTTRRCETDHRNFTKAVSDEAVASTKPSTKHPYLCRSTNLNRRHLRRGHGRHRVGCVCDVCPCGRWLVCTERLRFPPAAVEERLRRSETRLSCARRAAPGAVGAHADARRLEKRWANAD